MIMISSCSNVSNDLVESLEESVGGPPCLPARLAAYDFLPLLPYSLPPSLSLGGLTERACPTPDVQVEREGFVSTALFMKETKHVE